MISNRVRRLRRSRYAFTLIELLVVFGIISILMGLLLSAVQRVREAAARLKCQSNLRQIALALHNHNDTRKRLPPGHRSLIQPDRRPYSGWPLDILPFIEQSPLHAAAMDAYRVDLYPFRNPPHTGLNTIIPLYGCPSESRMNEPQFAPRSKYFVAFTCYLGVSGRDATTKDGMLYQDSRTRLIDATDGTSNTLLVGERPPSADNQFGWWYAGNGQIGTGSADMIQGVREKNLLLVSVGSCAPGSYPFMSGRWDDQCSMFHFWSLHPGGSNFAFADGSVRFLSYSANPIMPALASRAGGEVVSIPD